MKMFTKYIVRERERAYGMRQIFFIEKSRFGKIVDRSQPLLEKEVKILVSQLWLNGYKVKLHYGVTSRMLREFFLERERHPNLTVVTEPPAIPQPPIRESNVQA